MRLTKSVLFDSKPRWFTLYNIHHINASNYNRMMRFDGFKITKLVMVGSKNSSDGLFGRKLRFVKKYTLWHNKSHI